MLLHSLAVSLATLQAPALPAAAMPLRGSGPWTVQYAENMCAMGRKFDGVGGPVTMVVKAPLLGGDYTFTIARPTAARRDAARGEARLVRPGEAPSEASVMETFTGASNQRISRFTIDGASYQLRSNAAQLTIDMGAEGRPSFAVIGLPKALDKLEDCTRGLRKGFGIDQQLLDRVAVPYAFALPTTRMFSSSDYPVEAYKRGEQGTAGALIYIEPNGRVKECRVIEPSRSRALDATTCNVLRARFRATPAKDAQGNALRVPTHMRIRWVLPSF